jgi:hypothetical protein
MGGVDTMDIDISDIASVSVVSISDYQIVKGQVKVFLLSFLLIPKPLFFYFNAFKK